MSKASLPSAKTALASLRKNGNQFEAVPLVPEPLGGVTYPHHGSDRTVAADPRVLRATGRVYVADRTLRIAVHEAGGKTDSLLAGAAFLARVFAQPRLIWGVSGYASIGISCTHQADLLEAFYHHLTTNQRGTALVSDGAAGAGVLGISGVLAAEHNIPTFGVSPLEGMSTMAPRDHMVIYGNTYQEREKIVGLVPDLLLIVGGGDGSRREGVAALEAGSRVLLLDSNIPWRTVPKMRDAVHSGKLLVRSRIDEIPAAATQLQDAALPTMAAARRARLGAIRHHFKSA
ncbi:MAG TPA: hypothetical protein VJ841_05480 [Candidatus Saccharimonadales bacterium]|nr:hypothetical protein [Candidatus Saccharimonadales bacterium]